MDTKELITSLRANFADEISKSSGGDDVEALSCFDRAALATVLNGSDAPKPLTRGQKAAATRAANAKKKATKAVLASQEGDDAQGE